MQTIEIKLYSFEELNEDAKEIALRNQETWTDYVWDLAYQTVKAFNELFGLKEGRDTWLEYKFYDFNDQQLELKGLRLRTFIINQFGDGLYKRKYRKSFDKTNVKSHRNLVQKSYGQAYYSSIFKNDTSCVLNGVCYDDDMLKPIYEFIEFKDAKNMAHVTIEDLFNDCFYSLKRTIEKECECLNSDEYKIEQFEENQIFFLENGTKYLW
jgi:hypothetical protein